MKFNSFRFNLTVLFALSVVLQNTLAKRIGDGQASQLEKGKKEQLQHEGKTRKLLLGYDFYFSIPDVIVLRNQIHLCFSSETRVAHVLNKGNDIAMSEIEVGDRVLTSRGKYETVYSIDHRHPNKETEFLQIHFQNTNEAQKSSPLELTEKHMVFLEGASNPVPASSIQVGDYLQTVHESSKRAQITDIKKITREGLFNPLTTGDGTIAISGGVVASTYSAFTSDNEYLMDGFKLSHHQFFNMILKPYKFMCTSISLELCKTNQEKVAISALASQAFSYWKQQSVPHQNTLLMLALSMAYLINFIFSPYFFVASLGMAYCWYKSSLKNQRKVKAN